MRVDSPFSRADASSRQAAFGVEFCVGLGNDVLALFGGTGFCRPGPRPLSLNTWLTSIWTTRLGAMRAWCGVTNGPAVSLCALQGQAFQAERPLGQDWTFVGPYVVLCGIPVAVVPSPPPAAKP